MSALLAILAKVFGISAGASAVNNIGGVLSSVALIPIGAWLLANADKEIQFRTSFGFLALVVGVAYLVLEVLRRSRPGPAAAANWRDLPGSGG